MNNQDYEKARQECWDALYSDLLKGEVQWQPVSRKEIVNFVFDCAYALGKEKDAITQEEIVEAAKDYAYDIDGSDWERQRARDGFVDGANFALFKQEEDAEDDKTLKVNRQLFCRLCADADDYINEHLEEEDSDYGYYQGRSDALHELYRGVCKDPEDTVISGWMARDTDDLLRLHYSKPERTDGGYWRGGYKSTYFPKGLFPDLTWSDDPIEVELIIKRKKNGY